MAQLLTLWRDVSGKIEQDESENAHSHTHTQSMEASIDIRQWNLLLGTILLAKKHSPRHAHVSMHCNIDFECVATCMRAYCYYYDICISVKWVMCASDRANDRKPNANVSANFAMLETHPQAMEGYLLWFRYALDCSIARTADRIHCDLTKVYQIRTKSDMDHSVSHRKHFRIYDCNETAASWAVNERGWSYTLHMNVFDGKMRIFWR